MLREEFAFLFQTFSRNAPLERRRRRGAVLKKEKRKREHWVWFPSLFSDIRLISSAASWSRSSLIYFLTSILIDYWLILIDWYWFGCALGKARRAAGWWSIHWDSGCPHIPKEFDEIVIRTEMASAKIVCIRKNEQECTNLRFRKSNHAINFKLYKILQDYKMFWNDEKTSIRRITQEYTESKLIHLVMCEVRLT